MKQRTASLLFLAIAAAGAATPAAAYVGPGAGLSLLSALWGLVVAIAVTVGFVVLWPLRRMLKKRQVVAAGAKTREAGSRPDKPPM